MRLVVVESPYAGDVERNLRYLRAAMADSLARGEAPYASHGLYTQPGVLRDGVPAERRLGIEAGFAWGERADLVAVYDDLGVTPGMLAGIARAEARGTPVERRQVPGWDRELSVEDRVNRKKSEPAPIPASALRCPVHREELTEAGLCASCVRERRVETVFIVSLVGAMTVGIVLVLASLVVR